jgi:hypothetical protein
MAKTFPKNPQSSALRTMIVRLRVAMMAVAALMAAAIGGFASPAHADHHHIGL